MKTSSQIYQQHKRIFHKLMEQGKRKAAATHPETGGCEMLVHNWGNDASRLAWEKTWARVHKLDEPYKRLYDQAEHVRHTALNFVPLWCEYCQK